MNTLEQIKTILLSVLLSSSIIVLIISFSDFVYNQNLNNYFLDEEVYNFSEDSYLLKENVSLCGEEYYTGDIVQKKIYNYCKKK